MKAAVFDRYGPPEVLHLAEVARPVPAEDEVLVEVRASTVTAGDWRMRKAVPFAARLYNGLLRPRRVTILGFELAGDVAAVGETVRRFQVGDRVFAYTGFGFGAYAEYICLPEASQGGSKALVANIPASMTYAEAATIPTGGLAALNCLRQGAIDRGQSVLIVGASGGVGAFAVQLARHFGAEVTGVCSTRNLKLVADLGAGLVIDYTRDDFRKRPERYDLIFDAAGPLISGLSKRDARALLKPGGRYVHVEMRRKDRVDDLAYLADLFEAGRLKTVIDRCYPLEEIVKAHRYVEKGRKRGHVVITVTSSEND